MNRITTNFLKSSSQLSKSTPKAHFSTISTPITQLPSSLVSEEEYNKKNNFTPIDNSFAVVHISGKQFKVIKGDVIMTDRLNINVGEHIVLDKVLLVGTKESTMIGKPLVESVKVHAYVEEQPKAEHVIIFKHKPRKNYKRTTGYQALATHIRIGDIIQSNN
ncbi:hypothetical protein DICPUDRAFT_27582 [Dictyostelium purpureum]|uniref:Large ribosomal subunit protein bL21m n=1 Tax=Dictyostelium purpureum TaxID=5786 RepID=F0ZAJ2_DICPU|nr:uncharacterized protein DICPUDRAFT_27582 [Dictyostelium purpureum]EGC39083.1 hypothetical protein DICPUDRAFT_27582 [Dictyostelium purpureum]|eukprot:XP_003284433.1 hypothetical protein DICPUDRAFT_27582 [Dictyostelium purpureum]